eukprot:352215-Prymnesium_polylepis.1
MAVKIDVMLDEEEQSEATQLLLCASARHCAVPTLRRRPTNPSSDAMGKVSPFWSRRPKASRPAEPPPVMAVLPGGR